MKSGMKKLIVDIPDEVHRKLKQKALDENTTIKVLVNKDLILREKILNFIKEYDKAEHEMVNIESDWDTGYWLGKLKETLR